MIKEGKISKEKAQELMDLEPSAEGFDDKWSKIIASVPGLADKEHLALKKIKETKVEESKKADKLEEEFLKAYEEYKKLIEGLKDELMGTKFIAKERWKISRKIQVFPSSLVKNSQPWA